MLSRTPYSLEARAGVSGVTEPAVTMLAIGPNFVLGSVVAVAGFGDGSSDRSVTGDNIACAAPSTCSPPMEEKDFEFESGGMVNILLFGVRGMSLRIIGCDCSMGAFSGSLSDDGEASFLTASIVSSKAMDTVERSCLSGSSTCLDSWLFFTCAAAFDLVRRSCTSVESGRVISNCGPSKPESLKDLISKKISSVLVLDDPNDWTEASELHGASWSVDSVKSSALATSLSFFLSFSGPGFSTSKLSCIGDNRAGDVATLLKVLSPLEAWLGNLP